MFILSILLKSVFPGRPLVKCMAAEPFNAHILLSLQKLGKLLKCRYILAKESCTKVVVVMNEVGNFSRNRKLNMVSFI